MRIKGIWETRQVFIEGKELTPEASQKVCNHSPDGFCWGYQGSGPAQLALAILLREMPEEKALLHCQEFKREFIAGLPQGDFEIPDIKFFQIKKEGEKG